MSKVANAQKVGIHMIGETLWDLDTLLVSSPMAELFKAVFAATFRRSRSCELFLGRIDQKHLM